MDSKGQTTKNPIRKIPYKYSYKFLTEGDKNPRTLMIEDWEIGTLYWKALDNHNDDEKKANEDVKQKYFEELAKQRDLYLFLGTTQKFQAKNAPNPFIIIGLFYPNKLEAEQLLLL